MPTCLKMISSPVQVRHQLLGRVARGAHELFQLRAANCCRHSPELGLEHLGNRHATVTIGLFTSWATRPPSAANRSASIRFFVGGVEFEQRAFGLFLRRAQLLLGLALGDGVFCGTPRPRAPSRRPRPARSCPGPAGHSHLARIAVMICWSGSRIESAIRTPAVRMMPRKITAIDNTLREMSLKVRSKVSCAFCFALVHLDRQIVDGADCLGLAGIDRIAQQIGTARKLFANPSRSAAVRAPTALAPCAAGRCRQGRS